MNRCATNLSAKPPALAGFFLLLNLVAPAPAAEVEYMPQVWQSRGADINVIAQPGSENVLVIDNAGQPLFEMKEYSQYGHHQVVGSYEGQLLLLHEGGRLTPVPGVKTTERTVRRVIERTSSAAVRFDNCDGLTLLLAADTDYLRDASKDFVGEHPHKKITDRLSKASNLTVGQLRAAHVADFTAMFNRITLQLGPENNDHANMPTDERHKAYREGAADPGFEVLALQMARYMIMSCSRPGCLPANLQGIWNNSNRPAIAAGERQPLPRTAIRPTSLCRPGNTSR